LARLKKDEVRTRDPPSFRPPTAKVAREVVFHHAFRPIQHPDIAARAAKTIVNAEIFLHSADCAVRRLLELPDVFFENQ
jgi:hypothetical protein